MIDALENLWYYLVIWVAKLTVWIKAYKQKHVWYKTVSSLQNWTTSARCKNRYLGDF